MFPFLTFFGHETAVAEVWVKMTTSQLSALFREHFYLASGYCWRTPYMSPCIGARPCLCVYRWSVCRSARPCWVVPSGSCMPFRRLAFFGPFVTRASGHAVAIVGHFLASFAAGRLALKSPRWQFCTRLSGHRWGPVAKNGLKTFNVCYKNQIVFSKKFS